MLERVTNTTKDRSARCTMVTMTTGPKSGVTLTSRPVQMPRLVKANFFLATELAVWPVVCMIYIG